MSETSRTAMSTECMVISSSCDRKKQVLARKDALATASMDGFKLDKTIKVVRMHAKLLFHPVCQWYMSISGAGRGEQNLGTIEARGA
jgi:hypothetical protein